MQTGYLTVDKIISSPRRGSHYQLKIPNKEVRIALSEHIIKTIAKQPNQLECSNDLYTALELGDMTLMHHTLIKIFASIPYYLYSNTPLAHYEGYYSVVIYSYLLSLGVSIQLEKSTNKGRLDMVIDIEASNSSNNLNNLNHLNNLGNNGNLNKNRYLIEFKMLPANKSSSAVSANSAIQQIKQKEYFQAFLNAQHTQKIYLVGICFDENERNLAKKHGFEWEELQ